MPVITRAEQAAQLCSHKYNEPQEGRCKNTAKRGFYNSTTYDRLHAFLRHSFVYCTPECAVGWRLALWLVTHALREVGSVIRDKQATQSTQTRLRGLVTTGEVWRRSGEKVKPEEGRGEEVIPQTSSMR